MYLLQTSNFVNFKKYFKLHFCLNLKFQKSALAGVAVGVNNTSRSLAIAQVSKLLGLLAGTARR